MEEWNAVLSINERGLKEAYAKLGRFGLLKKTGFFNVLLLKADDLPALLETLWGWLQEDPAALAFLSRLIPVTQTFTFQSAGEFEERARETVLPWAPRLAGKGFYVRMRRRGFKGKLSSLEEERFLDTFLLEQLEKAGIPGHINFTDPDAVLAVETVGGWAGLSLWDRAELQRYPFIRFD